MNPSEGKNKHVTSRNLRSLKILGYLDGCLVIYEPALVAQANEHPIVDQKVVGLIPALSGNILLWRLIM